MKVDPCVWWKERENEYPLLSRVARKYLGIPGASAAAERMFSYTGYRVGKRNTGLSDDSLLDMMLIRALKRFVLKWGRNTCLTSTFFIISKIKSTRFLL